MTTVYRTLTDTSGEIHRMEGTFVLSEHGAYVLVPGWSWLEKPEKWFPSKSEADANEIARLRAQMARIEDTINRLLPAVAAAHAGSGESASGGREITPQPGDGGAFLAGGPAPTTPGTV
jgi:hypothetical protein